jgi:hypothetical protein
LAYVSIGTEQTDCMVTPPGANLLITFSRTLTLIVTLLF